MMKRIRTALCLILAAALLAGCAFLPSESEPEVVGWVFFRADTLADAKVILHQMFTWENGIYPASLFVNRKVIFLAVLGVLLSGIAQSICPKLREHLYEKEVTKTVDIVIMAVLLFLCTMYLVSSTYNPFIYFRF